MEIEEYQSSTDRLSGEAEHLSKISSRLLALGFGVFVLSFLSAAACVAALAIAQTQGLWDTPSNFSFSDEMNVKLFSALAMMAAMATLTAIVARDGLIRRGQVISDVLIEASERMSAIKIKENKDLTVKVAIRSFAHLKSLPLSSGSFSASLYVVLATTSLLLSIYLLVASSS